MTDRLFDRVTIKQNGLARAGYRLTCRDCSATSEIAITSVRALPPEFIKSKFSQRGWVVADVKQRDMCPACVKQKSIERRGNVVALNKPSAAAEKPRELSREDKRLIFGKIDSVYLDEKRGYEGGWSDKRVADDLGVPLAWVRTIRETDFGQEGLCGDSREVVAAYKKISEDLTAIDARFCALAKEFSDIKSRFARTERSVEDVRKLTVNG